MYVEKLFGAKLPFRRYTVANVLHVQVQGISLTLYVYQLRKDEKGVENVAVEKVTYTKPVATGGS